MLATPPRTFEWKRFPEAEALVDRLLRTFLEDHAFAARLAGRMMTETSTRFVDWVDHLVLSPRASLVGSLESVGYRRDILTNYDVNALVFEHDGGLFPRVAVAAAASPGREVQEVALKVESIADFSRAHDLGLEAKGYALGPYRIAKMVEGSSALSVVERRGYRGFDPYSSEMARLGRMTPQFARDALAARDLWHGRRRRFDDDAEGFDHTDSVLERVIELCGGSTDLACHLIFESERDYWESRNHAARIQKQRQDRLGLGWANHDHHTFRSSRRFFPRLIAIFERLGFSLREHFHAGANAGWGAQVLEHPNTGIVIFADLDLAPEEVSEDFAHKPLPDLPRPNTVGLWVGLHGESILEAGMHHLEAQFDFDGLRDDLRTEAGIETMKPFSDFPFLRQAFTQGERWPVNLARADRLLAQGWIDDDQRRRFVSEGAIGSHLENLQRREGYKGFNQQAVSAIIAATDPRLQG
ncbi:MAG TPA: hypothetical protein VFT74_05600 [Isosphaeraceae bacterium]|nr:hypothetical protein [Isosphaeraceae bacterium]